MSDKNWNIYGRYAGFAKKNSEKVLLSVNGEEKTYGDFVNDCSVLSSCMRNAGITQNEKVGIILPNCTLWYELFWSIVNIGACPVPLDPQTGQWELEQAVRQIGVRYFFTASKYRGNMLEKHFSNLYKELSLKKVVITDNYSEKEDDVITSIDTFKSLSDKILSCDIYQVEYKDTLSFVCTSGTTGNPKIINVEHGGFYKAMDDMADYLDFTSDDNMLLGMPLYHQGGFGMGVQMLMKGGTVFYQTQFNPIDFLETVQRNRITVMQLTATLAKIILTVPEFDKYDISSLKMCYFAGEVLPDEIAARFYKDLNIRVINIIGSSETGTMVIWDSDCDKDVDVNCFRTLPFTKMRILKDDGYEAGVGEAGNIHIQTDAVLKEYFNNIEETRNKILYTSDKRWFNTGDLGIQCDDGRVKLIGRVKRIIKRGSNLVYPEEIESFLLTHPYITAVAVMKEEQELYGEMIAAYIQVVNGINLTRGDYLKFCRGQLSAYKIPDKFVIVDEMPNDIGKIQYKYLREKLKE